MSQVRILPRALLRSTHALDGSGECATPAGYPARVLTGLPPQPFVPDRRQYAPSLRTTAPTVREMIRISRPMDQLST
ncbi:Uncharacterised protein [Mycobacteroides abscessus subsp. abscessus]|nr:Uncharacterised protein [Mycobacteroides abscessus subsp. abscessus]